VLAGQGENNYLEIELKQGNRPVGLKKVKVLEVHHLISNITQFDKLEKR
jgi:hypothetical protein